MTTRRRWIVCVTLPLGLIAIAVAAGTLQPTWPWMSQASLWGLVAFVWGWAHVVHRSCPWATRREWTLYAINFVGLYVLVVAAIRSYDWYVDYRLDLLDLNGDGVFSRAEQTPEQVRLMALCVNDLGRNLIVITGAGFALVSSALLGVVRLAYGAARSLGGRS